MTKIIHPQKWTGRYWEIHENQNKSGILFSYLKLLYVEAKYFNTLLQQNAIGALYFETNAYELFAMQTMLSAW